MKKHFYLYSGVTLIISILLMIYKYFTLDYVGNKQIINILGIVLGLILLIFWNKTGNLRTILQEHSKKETLVYVVVWVIAAFAILI